MDYMLFMRRESMIVKDISPIKNQKYLRLIR